MTTKNIRTRFAPSPTGFIHLGNIRSALYPWAFARHTNGVFILRIEDTDADRSTQDAVDVILQGMSWLGMAIDEGPFYQTARLDRYKQVIEQMLANGSAYYCYTSMQELDEIRDTQKQYGQKPKYDGTWRPEIGKTLPATPDECSNIKPVVRFKNPLEGLVSWDDAVKGKISIANKELDDFIIARADGMPTYNFCVVVDDIDMEITHVIRGDDHVNNTPRQINIFNALNKDIPVYAHLPTVLNEDGEKMSKRNGAMHIMKYKEEGYLPEAILNYLARLGWSHGNEEIFSIEQFIQWFNLESLGASAAQFSLDKLKWVNSQYIKHLSIEKLHDLCLPFLQQNNYNMNMYSSQNTAEILYLFKDRASTLKELSNLVGMFYNQPYIDEAIKAQMLEMLSKEHVKESMLDLIANIKELSTSDEQWSAENISYAFKKSLAKFNLKMPLLAMPIRLMLLGSTNTPAIDKIIFLLGSSIVIERLASIVI
jgi:glutamyl-tRNA synthetase